MVRHHNDLPKKKGGGVKKGILMTISRKRIRIKIIGSNLRFTNVEEKGSMGGFLFFPANYKLIQGSSGRRHGQSVGRESLLSCNLQKVVEFTSLLTHLFKVADG
jgi:hypothetical protein